MNWTPANNILVAVDNTMPSMDAVKYAIGIARATDSGLIVLGIIPVHLYNRWEKELEVVEKSTKKVIDSVKEMSEMNGVKATALIRSGYPDEEIIKVSAECDVSMVIMPSGKGDNSELCKAATILLNESARLLKKPLVLVPAV